MDMGVASDVIVATITRFAVRIGLPGRPVPHGRQSLQTAHTASQKTHWANANEHITPDQVEEIRASFDRIEQLLGDLFADRREARKDA